MRFAKQYSSKQEKDLETKGYKFSGFYTSNSKQEAKDVAAEYRAKGYFATVATKIYSGRIHSIEGYSVYIKEKKQKGPQQ